MLIIVLSLRNILYVMMGFVKHVMVVCRLLFEEESDQRMLVSVEKFSLPVKTLAHFFSVPVKTFHA